MAPSATRNLAALPVGRRERKRERTRREIYDAAMELFARRSYEAVTIDMICEAADVGRSTFFLHFPAKAALLDEFSRRMADDFSADLVNRARVSAGEILVALIQEIGIRIEAQRETILAMIREFTLTPEAIEHSRETERQLPDLIESIVRRGQQSGEFHSEIDPRLATGAILSTAGSILCGWVFGRRRIAPQEVQRQFLEMIFRGLGGRVPNLNHKGRMNR